MAERPPPVQSSTADERAEQLLRAGLDIAVRIRDEDPARLAAELAGSSSNDLRDMVMLLAACIPVDLPVSVLLGWWLHPPRELRPCGTLSAARRHRARSEHLDELCQHAEREEGRVRKRQQRASRSCPGRAADSTSTQRIAA